MDGIRRSWHVIVRFFNFGLVSCQVDCCSSEGCDFIVNWPILSVLGTLLKNKLVPDPFYGLNNDEIIDIADSGREYYTFWFFTRFHCKLVGQLSSPAVFSLLVIEIFFSYIQIVVDAL